jgi:hypothetical protein
LLVLLLLSGAPIAQPFLDQIFHQHPGAAHFGRRQPLVADHSGDRFVGRFQERGGFLQGEGAH